MIQTNVFQDRRGVWVFALGCIGVTIGVLLHIPMFWMGHNNGFVLYGMPMDPGMIFGMYLIIAGVIAAGYGLLPSKAAYNAVVSSRITVVAPEDAPLSRAHWMLMATLVVALIIDVMKPATLGFTIPGMIREYQTNKAARFAGSVFCADRDGERVDSLGYPGGLLWPQSGDPVLGGRLHWNVHLRRHAVVELEYRDVFPDGIWRWRHAAGDLRAAGGDDAVEASRLGLGSGGRARRGGRLFCGQRFRGDAGAVFSWRILWLMNLPTGLILLGLGRFIPESAKFLLARGRNAEAHAVMARFGTVSHKLAEGEADESGADRPRS